LIAAIGVLIQIVGDCHLQSGGNRKGVELMHLAQFDREVRRRHTISDA